MRRLLAWPLLLALVLGAALAQEPALGAAPEAAMQSRAVDTRVTLAVAEGVPPGTLVGAIPTKPGFTYRFNEAPREFSLDARSGAIRTAAQLDREALRSDRFDLVVLSSQPTYPIEVRITVLDVNDNAPAFPEPSIAVAFSESAAPGTRVLLDAAADADAGANGVSDDYRIVAGNRDGRFRLVVTDAYLHLETTARLDREQAAAYALNVSARDGGDPPLYGFLAVNVTVLDVNDNPPIFDHSDYTVSLNESAPPGTHVLQVTATDSDAGDNARIAYYLSEGERQFSVDAETGAISTAEALSCPQQSCASASAAGCPKSCVFTVFARDHGSPRQDGRTYVTVNLVDANDHDPVIKFRYFPSTSGFATVDENAANGSVVAAVSVVDQDEGPNGETTVEIRAGNELGHFRLDSTPSFDIVRVHGVLDREQVSKYNLTVVASDRGSPPRTATAFLIVHVNDVNDHEPVFAKSEYSAVLSELAPAGSYVASIAATDEDSGVNARIYYAFVSGNERGWFHIDEDSGLVTTRAPLDREAQDTAELRVSARDGGPNPRWAYTQLKVAVLDENDERPRFSQERIEVSLPESAPAGTLVAMLTAEDADQGTNGSVAYELPRPADYPGEFSLDALTGQLTLRRPLDREARARYEVRVVARDRGVAAPALSASATVLLTVTDENDNSPAFYPQHYFAAVPHHLPVGATVLQVSATDRDEGANAEVRYALEEGDAALFAVEERSGAVTLRAPLPPRGPSWRLRVSARDGGGRRAQPDAAVELVPRDLLAALEFDSAAGYSFQIAEDDGSAPQPAAGGRVVGRVRARRPHAADADAGAADAVTYAVVAGDPAGSFQVDAASGVISTRAALDREAVASYSLRVLARAGLAAGEAVVNITVTDLNDNAPEFPGVPTEVRVAENAAVGQQVCLCRALDRDAAAHGRLTYSVARDPAGAFGVAPATGVLFVRRPLRAPPGTALAVEVAATDGGRPPRTAAHALSVLVVDVNDHTPVFDHTSYETSLLESTPVNERFFALSASDADLGANGQVRYAISEGDAAGRFGVFPDGWLYVRSALDRERRDYYSLLVTAADGGDPPRSSQVPVTVHVVDENDNAPQFANATFQFRVRENEPPDSFVGKLSAWDRDAGRNAELTFALAGGADRRDFAVDPKNGFVKTLHVFDREQLVRDTGQSFVVLEATVTDNGAQPLADRAEVYVHVADENDNAPRFLRTPYRVQVSEAAAAGTQVFRVFTTDADEGVNGQVEYSLAGGNEAGRFAVDAATGAVWVSAALDRERAPAYALVVEARDLAADPARRLSATATLAVDVLDENDNAPRFTAPPLPRLSVAETTPVGTELARFAAADADAGVNAEVSFSLSGGNRRDAFAVDAATGALYLHRPLDYEELAAYALNVTACDGGNPRLCTALLFRVDVEDSNDNPPAFPNTAIVRQIREGIPQGTPIVTVAAEDPDSGANGRVAYRIGRQEPPGPAHFGIDPATGVIRTLLPVDREAVDTFRLTVVATDLAEPESARLSAEKLVTVIVEDANDNAPQFVSMNAAVLPAAARDAPDGGDVPVAAVRARDLDSGTNGLVTYDLVSGGGELFRLDRNSGLLTVRRGAALPEPRYHLAVKASDEAVQAERKASDAYLTVLAAPAGPGAPRFQAVSAGSVYENEPAGTSVLTLRAAAAAPDAAVEYYVTNVTWAGSGRQADRLFDVDARLGVLSTAAPLDREAGPPHYAVTVAAVVVAGAPPALATTTVRVTVLDRNDSPPSLSPASPRELSVSEELPPGPAPVATLAALDPDLEGAVRFSLAPPSARFALDARSGALTLRAPLDREAAAQHRLTVRLDDGVQHSDTDIVVHVTDANDNPPVFGAAAYSFDVPEGALRGARVGQVAASDLDEGANALLSYALASHWANDAFSLDPHSGLFTLTARLDYEEVAHYIFVVEARDAGRPSLSSTVSVYVNVLDLNDNAPLFDPMSYSNEVPEDAPVGSPVLAVSATDLDSGDNGRIDYSISAGDPDGAFAITSNGTVVTARPLDREARALYGLVVTAADRGRPPLSSTVQVTVVLKDVNDAAPEFISPGEVSVAENTPPGTVVLAVKAVDRDEGRNGYVEYSLLAAGADDGDDADADATDADAARLFSVGATDGLVRVTGRLDREARALYRLRLEARDRGQPPLATRTTLRVRVLDENDNSPVFDPRQYSASVAENASIGASVLQVSATDVDEGGNGVVRYAIVAGDDNRDFSIGEDTGVVRVAGTLNFERAPRYVLTVRASDGGRPARHDAATVAVSVRDINDNPPVFLDSPYLAYVMENVVPPEGGGFVVTVHAHDADSPPHNAQVRYFLKEGDADLFRVNATSGEVRVLRPLDREARDHYILTLVAMDTGTPPLTGTGTVRVEVQDANDNAPEFARQAFEATVSENLAAGARVLRAEAADRDAGDNGRLRYSLLGEHAAAFTVDPDTGEVRTAASLDREQRASYLLTLVARDCSPTEPRAAAANLTVRVADDNDNAPAFSQDTYTVYVPDDTQPGDFVFGAEAEDPDAGANGTVRFSLSGAGAALLTVEAETGVVRAAAALPAEVRALLRAADGGREAREAGAQLVVRARPARLFPRLSLVSAAAAAAALPEDAPAGRPVAALSAASPKAGPAARLSYAVAGGNRGGALRVDPVSGEVVVAGGGLDYETAPSFSVWLEARDNDSPPLRSVVRLDVTVQDANDNAPVPERAVYSAEVPEEQPPPVLVCRVHADDADTGVNGEVSYRLRPTESSALFSVDAVTGEVWTQARLDREQTASHQLVVEVVDGGTPALSGTATVQVTVRDENDNPPRFTRLFSVNVTENAELGSFVIRVTSSDRDIGENANASYSFADNPGERFAIDPVTGNVTVAGLLDREAQDEYLLKVAAVDGSWRAETPLTVTVQDQNDNAPEFEHSYYSFSVPETTTGSGTNDVDSEVGTSGRSQQQRQQFEAVFVGRVVATDRDKQGPNSVISYALQQPSDTFTVDPASGDIFSKRRLRYKHSASLDRSPENQYSFTVTATDNGKPPMSSECLVTVDVVDANNNSPEFETDRYFSPVPEKAPVGLQIIKVTAHDDQDVGVNAEVEYVKTGAGNGSQLFQVARDTGWISVARALGDAGVTYTLGVRARDHGVPPRHADVTVTLVVTTDNRHSPVFNTLSYQVIVPENEPVGSTIVTLSATDGDDGPNGVVRYSISSGSECEEFAVSAETGAVTIRRPLDYDSVPEYHLNITASDLAFEPRHATATLRVTLTDVNDNAPIFEHAEYSASVRENAPADTAVFTLCAHDADSARYAVVRYSLVGGSGRDVFRLDPETGVLYSRQPFDYEQTQLYTLDVLAANPDSPMYGSTKVVVHVTGENEFYPRFVQPVFHLDVSESAEVGTSVGTVRATDEDAGDDGHVFYLFVGASNDRGFSIVAATGEIRVARRLDRETQSRAVLTVLAKNGGSIRGNDTDEAQVIISIQDGNDPPEFEREVYEAEVSEGAAPGALVATVHATDTDVRPQNNHFSYSIIAGNAQHAFKVDPATGAVETTSRLDREVTPAYALVVGAIDTGTPPQTGTATLRVRVIDVNDNGPQLAEDASRGYVSENEPAGTSVMTLTATDPDLPPNGAPFAYSIVGGRHRDLVSVERHSGLVRTTRPLDREVTPELDIIVEVEDSGEPPMRSQLPVTVVVLDQNDSPSTPRAVHVLVYAFEGQLPHGKIADVRPNDADTTGDYHCEVQSGGGGLTIPVGTCELHALPSLSQSLSAGTGAGRGLALAVAGNDGVHADVVSAVTVELAAFDRAAVENAVPLRAENATAERFLAAHYKAAVDALRATFPAPADAPLLFGLRQDDTGLEMAVAVRSRQGYRDKAAVAEALSRAAPLLPASSVAYSACRQRTPCQNGASCSEALRVRPNQTLVWDSRTLIFATPAVILEVECQCTEGFAGERCDRRQDPCSPSPCLAGGTCHRAARLGDFSCSCPPLREGRLCELERGAVCSTHPCLHGGSCRESSDGASFFCLCRPGFRGNRCEAAADSCRPNPCAHGGVCIALPPPPALGYRCSCPDGRFGRHCEGSAFGFGELAFAAFPPLDATTNDVSVVFATTKPDALLVYNYGAQTGGRSDFVSLELVGGRATFSYGGARTAIATVQAGGELADGHWHRVTATRNGRVLSLSVASCSEDGDACRDCRPGDRSCSADEFGPTGTLNFDGSPMLVGGLPSVEAVLERPGQVHSDELVGCVHSVTVNGRALNLSSPLRARAVSPTCSRPRLLSCDSTEADSADRERCGPAGRCAEEWPSRRCECHTGSSGPSPEWVLAPDCGPALAPVSLAAGARLDLSPGERLRRLQLLDSLYRGTTRWRRPPTPTPAAENHRAADRAIAFAFRTLRTDAALFFAASNSDFTSIELRGGQLVYVSRLGGAPAVNTSAAGPPLSDGTWHHVRLCTQRRALSLVLDGARAGDELDAAGVHDFLDPDLTALSLGGVPPNLLPGALDFEGCFANFTVNDELQPFNGTGSILPDIVWHGTVTPGCTGPAGLATTATPDPLSIGITLVIVFFVVLLVAILVSFIVFRLRRQKKEKGGSMSGGGIVGKQNGGTTLVSGGGGPGGGSNDGSGGGCGVLGGRGLSAAETAAFLGETGEVLRPHHLVGPELIAKKYKEREIVAQRPDIIEREVVGKPLQPPLQPPQMSAPSSAPAPQPTSASVGPNDPDLPEHYDLENASSIAPSDIDIVYHYKGYREGGNVRKYRATPPHLPPPTVGVGYHHKHSASGSTATQQQQHRHSPRGGFAPPQRDSPRQAAPPPPSDSSPGTSGPGPGSVAAGSGAGGGPVLQSTPLARLSPSSELSAQQAPRILTLQDISGKPLQSALLATTSSSGGVGKDVLHSNSERSLNSPVMSQLSGQSSSASRKVSAVVGSSGVVGTGAGSVGSGAVVSGGGPVPEVGLTAEEIERLNSRPRTSSLVSTLDAVSSSSEAARGPSGPGGVGGASALHRKEPLHLHHSVAGAVNGGGGPGVVGSPAQHSCNTDDNASSTTTDESGNDSFTCSEFEYDNTNEKTRGAGEVSTSGGDQGKPPLPPVPPASYDGFDSSFRGSLSTLVASDDDLSTHVGASLYRAHNGSPSSTAAALGWDYLLNWGPNFESLVGVFKDIAELPDSVNSRVAASLRLPNSAPKPSEEYV